ncbi:MAG TPA: YfcE family phosphodiesterase [Solibacterales bacterium]|nr:YfcE family phosphodiesterase [Bryobacterales bacterium]
MTVGVISDTHSLLRSEAIAALGGVAHILHAGDIGHPSVLDALAEIAPVTAVSGNVDEGEWARRLPREARLILEGCPIAMAHGDLGAPLAAGAEVVVTGHTHQPRLDEQGGVLFLNPGSAGPRRFKLPVTLALLTLRGGERPRAEIIALLP